MREILFRGKRDKRYSKSQDWVYGVPFTDSDGDCIMKNKSAERVVECETVGQFTGLCDKNGKKIFEGDIVEAVGSTLTAVVQYFPEEGAFMLYCKERHFVDYLGTIEMSKIEIIGNVFENPELLKGDDKAE